MTRTHDTSSHDWANRIVRYGVQAADQFTANPRNPRRHPQAQRDAVKGSLDTLGFIAPVIINRVSGYLIDGHERVMQALGQGDDTPVPFIEVDLSEDEEAIALASFDWITYMATYDQDTLSDLLRDIDTDNAQLQALLDDIATQNNISLDDETPLEDAGPEIDRGAALAEQYGTALGQVWQLGKHRLIIGDSTDQGTIETLMQGKKADMVMSDPPYGMRLDTDYSQMPQTTVRGKHYNAVIGDDQDFDLTPFNHIQCKEQFWWGADYYCQQLPKGGSWFVWDKRIESNDNVIGSGFELCWSKTPHQRRMLRYLWSGFTARDPNELRSHPTQKPIAMYAELITDYSKAGALIFDPFMGSGTTMVAAEQTGRICYGVELDPTYAAVCLDRLAKMGLTPILEGAS